MPQQGQQQQADSQAAQAAAQAAQYQVYEPQLQFAQSKWLFERKSAIRPELGLFDQYATDYFQNQ